MDPLSDAAFFQAHDMSQAGAGADRALRVRFFSAPIPDAKETKDKGRPMFRSVDMCEIRVDKDNVVCGRVEKMHPDPRERFPVQYAKFRRGDTQQIVGTLLSHWGLMDSAEVAGYEAIGILTVEQLAALSDAQCQQYRGSLGDRQKAADFLAQAKGLEPVAQARAEAADLRAQIEAMREQIEAMKAASDEPRRQQTKR